MKDSGETRAVDDVQSQGEEALHSTKALVRDMEHRFLLHHLKGMPVKSLARMEGCSDRAIRYNLAIARSICVKRWGSVGMSRVVGKGGTL